MSDRPRTTDELRRLDKQYVWHPFTPMAQWLADDHDPLVITAADGMFLVDSDGNRYLDGVSSLWCNVHGHRVPEIDAAIRAQLEKVAHTTMLGLASEPAILLAERLIKIAPPGLAKVFYSDAGATATEVAFKLAAQYWFNTGKAEKNEFVGFSEGYHGDTVGAMSVGRTTAFHRPYFPLLFKVHYAPTPFEYRFAPDCDCNNATCDRLHCRPDSDVRTQCLACLERLLEQHHQRIAAVCIEPIVQGAAGMIVHPDSFLRGVRRLCDKYDVLLIADEVAVGFGRTGTMFACEHETVSPDIMCIAKGISGGYLPLAATLASQKIFDSFLGEPWEGKTFFHGHTYTGNPLACAAAIASLDLFEKNDLLAAVRRKSLELARMLEPLKLFPHVGNVRQKGFMVGIELVADKATKRPFDPKRRVGAEVCAKVRRHGVILRPLGDVIVLMPPLAMEVDDLRRIIDALEAELIVLSEN
jgi:adenosylmethionine-8-amino-7-oxononanoate aminotransferase